MKTAIDHAFLNGFQRVMLFSALLALASSVGALLMIDRRTVAVPVSAR